MVDNRHMLRKRWYYLLIFLIAFPPTLWLSAEVAKNRGMQQLQAESIQHLRLHAHNLDQEIEKHELLARVLSEEIKLHQLLQQPDNRDISETISRHLSHINKSARASVIYLMSTTGTTLASSNWKSPKSFVGKNYSFRPYFKHAVSGAVGRYTAVGATSGQLGHYIAHPVKKQGHLLGVIVVKVDLKGLELLYLDSSATLTVADDQGIIFLTGNPDFRYRTLRPLDVENRERITQSRQYADLPLDPLPIIREEIWDESTRIISLGDANGGGNSVDYMVRSGMLLRNGWQLNSYSRLETIDRQVYLSVGLSTLSLTSFLLLALYLQERRKYLQKLRAAAITDTLTGLYTRRYMSDAVNGLIEQHNRGPEFHLAATMMDIDYFKKINDTYGHKNGDQVLQQVARAIQSETRASDIAIRFGGEEFVAILLVKPGGDATLFAERVRHHIEALRFKGPLKELVVTISIGVSYHRQDETMENLLERADQQLYRAKNSGRNCVCIDSDQLDDTGKKNQES